MKLRTEIHGLNESSMSRILSHLKTDNIATLTSYITSDNHYRLTTPKKRTGNQNRASLQKLSADLKHLGYSFIRVDGEYREIEQNAVVDEASYFVISPGGYSLDTFTQDMKNLAKKYEQESVIVWDCENQEAVMYGTTDFKVYKKWGTFKKFSMNTPRDIYTRFKSHWFAFDDYEEEAPESFSVVEDEESEWSYPTPKFRISHFRQEMFGKWY